MYIEKEKNNKLVKTNIQALITLSPNQQKFKTQIQGKFKSFMIQTTDIHMNTLGLERKSFEAKENV